MKSRTNTYTSIKVFVHDDTTTSQVLNEIKTLKHMAGCPREHSGSDIARLPNDVFQLDGPVGQHYCTASKPQGCNLWDLRLTFPNGRLPKVLVVAAVRCLVGCINWLALDCDLIHTGKRYQYCLKPIGTPPSLEYRNHVTECPDRSGERRSICGD